ncbi:hypothetical protein LOTGIDRAFT_157899 [Lottia gigantea]|uniref:Uncharacterized protein n=1 Tax=Lottia gigantea TaxID=225164 RepID=V4A9E8_LOTGI|nr:hypothetical protein LOTGIDRAFT_157899 [Lottia gigantea]ESP00619.1 hypothetical protein LOTGIDRAFT_157899 [Lottia gigantea]
MAVVCVPNIPDSTSQGVQLVKYMFGVITEQVDDGAREAYSESDMNKFHDMLLEMLLKFIELGPGSGHCFIWREIFGWKRFKDYYQTISKEKNSKLLKSLKKVYYYKGESDIDNKKYYEELQKALLYIVDHAITDELIKQNYEEYLDIFMFYQTEFCTADRAVFNLMHTLAIKLWYKFGRKPFKGVTDPDLYRKYLKDMEQILCDDKVPTDDHMIKQLRSTLQYPILGIKEESGVFSAIYMEVMEFLQVLANKKTGVPPVLFLEDIGYLWFHVNADELKGNKAFIFDGMAPKFAEFLENLTDFSYCDVRLVKPALNNILGPVMNNSKEHCDLWIRILKAALPIQGCAEAVYYAVREQAKFLKWKTRQQEAKEVFIALTKIDVTYPEERKRKDTVDYYTNFAQYFLDQLKKAKVIPELLEELSDFCLTVLEEQKVVLYDLAYRVADYFDDLNFKKHKPMVMKVLKRVTALLRVDHEFDINRCCTLQEIQCNSFSAITDFKSLEPEDFDVLIDLCDAAVSGEFLTPDNTLGTEHYRISFVAILKTFQLISGSTDVGKIKDLIKKVVDLLEHEEDEVCSMATNQLYLLSTGQGGVTALGPHLPKLIESFIEKEECMLLNTINAVYPENGECMEKHFQGLFEFVDSGEQSIKSIIQQLLIKVATHQPQLFTEENVDKVLEVMFECDPNYQVSYLMIIDSLATKNIKILMHTLDTLLTNEFSEYCFYSLCSVLRKIASKSPENKAEKVMNKFVKFLSEPESQNTILVITEVRNLLVSHKALVERHKPLYEKIRNSATDQNLRDLATSLIDLLEGRTLLKLADDIEYQQGEIDNLDVRVTTNENTVNEVKVEVGEQKKDIKIIRKDVDDQGVKLNEVGEIVDVTVKKVEEIDMKTLSHAPYWSRDVSKLLNPKDEHDWRLLASRLGYSNDDIRAWSQQSDPCMAMLNEWYATHKTSEANYGIMNNLIEMNRTDAAVIVENAMKAAEQVVEDEDFEYVSPPPIFLSYQWSHQEEVKLLRKHLEMAGYDCWMDIGQMGGGDKLFEKIDRGIRAAKIIISCTTEKYAKSPNCNREVNLSANLRKPIIPLLLESCPWPPEGSMGPLFSEYLYIQFYQNSKEEETKDDRFWPIPKFQELLMQLNMNGVVPDEKKVHKMYKNWWMPIVEEIKVDKSKTFGGGKNKTAVTSSTEKKEDDKSPDVFISYQWDKQKNIMLLYKKLTELGYHCWMDIYQMGGGDSLYDKIDRGVRGSKVVISCVTEKYSLSANCRREVSLCDSLKRPIIPLLLESMTWPPRGPMSMAFTELLYIDVHSDPKIQDTWSGSKFDELRSKIEKYVPDQEVQQSQKNDEKEKPTEQKARTKEASDPIKKEKAEPVSKKLEEDPKVTQEQAAPPKKSSFVKSATPGSKTQKPPEQPSLRPGPSPEPKGSPTLSPAHTGAHNNPRNVRPTSAASKPSKKSSKACIIV